MLYFLDTEFIDCPPIIELISIGLAAEDGRTYYRQNLDCDFLRAQPWVQDHVYPYLQDFRWIADDAVVTHPWELTMGDVWKAPQTLAEEIVVFCGASPVFWGYYSAYDWVALCQLFGPLVARPHSWPFYCNDLKQWSMAHGDVRFERPPDMRHHALDDAQWIRETYLRYVQGAAWLPGEDDLL